MASTTTTTTYLVLTVLAAAACLLGPGVHACSYPVAEGRQNITFGTKVPKDAQMNEHGIVLMNSPFMKYSNNFCYPDEDSKDRVLITNYTMEALNGGLVYLNKEKRSDEHRMCFHLKTLRDGVYEFQFKAWVSKY